MTILGPRRLHGLVRVAKLLLNPLVATKRLTPITLTHSTTFCFDNLGLQLSPLLLSHVHFHRGVKAIAKWVKL